MSAASIPDEKRVNQTESISSQGRKKRNCNGLHHCTEQFEETKKKREQKKKPNKKKKKKREKKKKPKKKKKKTDFQRLLLY